MVAMAAGLVDICSRFIETLRGFGGGGSVSVDLRISQISLALRASVYIYIFSLPTPPRVITQTTAGSQEGVCTVNAEPDSGRRKQTCVFGSSLQRRGARHHIHAEHTISEQGKKEVFAQGINIPRLPAVLQTASGRDAVISWAGPLRDAGVRL